MSVLDDLHPVKRSIILQICAAIAQVEGHYAKAGSKPTNAAEFQVKARKIHDEVMSHISPDLLTAAIKLYDRQFNAELQRKVERESSIGKIPTSPTRR